MEEALKLIEKLIEDHKEKTNIDTDITVQSQEKGYRYALEDVRDEIKTMITQNKITLERLTNESICSRVGKIQLELFKKSIQG